MTAGVRSEAKAEPLLPAWCAKAKKFAPQVSLTCGLVILVAACAAFVMLPHLIRDKISESVAITSPSSKLYSGWIDPENDGVFLYRRFTFFNLTNPYEVARNGTPPNFVMRGPFVYREVRRKDPETVRWFPHNGTVAYRYSSTYHFEPDLSIDASTGEPLDDQRELLTVLNAPLFGLTFRMSKLPADIGFFPKWAACDLLRLLVNDTVLGPTGIMVQRTVAEILWGYVDPIWHSVHDYMGIVNYHAAQTFRSEWNGSYVVPSPYTFRSGQMCPLWDDLRECNNSANGYSLEVSGGSWQHVKDPDSDPVAQNGFMSKWAAQQILWWWGDQVDGLDGGQEEMAPLPTHDPNQGAKKHAPLAGAGSAPPSPSSSRTATGSNRSGTVTLRCTRVGGFDGTRFPPNDAVLHRDKLTLFLDMLWRNVDFVRNGSSRVFGIDTARFILDPDELDPEVGDNARCYQAERKGVLNFTRPLFGPALGTKAMYLDSDLDAADLNFTVSNATATANGSDSARIPMVQYLTERFGPRGSAAYRREFDSFIDIHALTGLSLRVSAKAMASTYFGPIAIDGCGDIAVTRGFPTVPYYPLVAVERSGGVSEEKARELKRYLELLEIIRGLNIAGFVLGTLMSIWGLYALVRQCRSELLPPPAMPASLRPDSPSPRSPLRRDPDKEHEDASTAFADTLPLLVATRGGVCSSGTSGAPRSSQGNGAINEDA